MTLPVDQETFAGKKGLGRRGLERDKLLKLWTQLTKIQQDVFFLKIYFYF